MPASLHSLRSLRLLSAALVAALGMSACDAAAASTTSGPPAPTQDPAAKAGGTLTLGVRQPQSTFLNAGIVGNQTFSALIDAPVAEGLLWYRSIDQTSKASTQADDYQPWLATEVPTTANGDVKTSGCPATTAKMCVTWKLRDGVKWHDGSALSSADVCSTYDLLWLKYGANNPTPLASDKAWSDAIDCREIDSLTATIDYNRTVGSYLSMGTGVMGILPAAVLGPALGSGANIENYVPNMNLGAGSGNPVGAYSGHTLSLDRMIDGTGPFVFSSQDANGIIYVKNKHYWNTHHQPHIDKLIIKSEPDLATEVSDAKSGAIDVAYDMRIANLADLKAAASQQGAKFQIQTIADAGVEKIDVNLCANSAHACGVGAWTNSYTADPLIRHAILEAINRQAIVDAIAPGATRVPKDSSLSLGAEWIGSTVTQTAYDPAKAKADLDAAGSKVSSACGTDSAANQFRAYKDGSCIAFNLGTTGGDPPRVQTETIVAADLAKVGIRIVTPFTPNVSNQAFFDSFGNSGVLATHAFDTAVYTNTLTTYADPDSLYTRYRSDQIPSAGNSGIGDNATGLVDPVVDAAFSAGRSEVDLANRATDYAKAATQLAKDLPEIPLYQQITVNTQTPQLRGVAANDLVWDFNTYDWYCTAGNCQAP